MRIESNAIEPFYVEVQESQFVLIEKQVIQEGPNTGNIREMTFGYFHNLEFLVKRVVQVKLSREEKTVNLTEFLSRWKKLQNELKLEL